MKIAFLGSGSYKSSLTYFRALSLAQELAKLNHQISLIVPSADKYNNFTPDKEARADGIELIQPWQPATKNELINFIPYLLSASYQLLKAAPDMIYVFKPTPLTLIGLLPRLLFGKALVVDLDDLGSEVMRHEKQPRLRVKLVSVCERLTLHFATAVVVSSTFLEDFVQAKYPEKPLTIVSNGVNPQQFSRAKGSDPRQAIYYFGAINRLELIETFLNALPSVLSELPETRITILGGGESLKDAQRLTDKLGIRDAVHFTDWLEPENIYQFVRFADIAICTQPDTEVVRAASNLKVFQYMAMGSAVVVSNVGDLPNYVGANSSQPAGAVVPADNELKLAKTLQTLLKDNQLRLQMAEAGRMRAETEYDWSVLANKLDAFLRNVADPKAMAITEGTNI